MSERLMSADDLYCVTGMKRYSKQAAWFNEQFGVTVVRSSNGAPVVPWSTFQALDAKRAGIAATPAIPERPALRPAILRSVK